MRLIYLLQCYNYVLRKLFSKQLSSPNSKRHHIYNAPSFNNFHTNIESRYVGSQLDHTYHNLGRRGPTQPTQPFYEVAAFHLATFSSSCPFFVHCFCVLIDGARGFDGGKGNASQHGVHISVQAEIYWAHSVSKPLKSQCHRDCTTTQHTLYINSRSNIKNIRVHEAGSLAFRVGMKDEKNQGPANNSISQ